MAAIHPFSDSVQALHARYIRQMLTFFHTLPSEEYEQIARKIVVINAPSRSIIISENEISDDVHFVLSGRVSVKSFSVTGHEVSYMVIEPGGMFGEFSALDGKPRSATVEAIEDTRLARMDASSLRACLMQHPALALEMSKHLVAKIRSLTERIFEFSTLPVNIRVRLELLRLARTVPQKDNSCIIAPMPSHQEIAARISTHREAVSRELSALARAGFIETSRRSVMIVNISRLRQHAGLSGI